MEKNKDNYTGAYNEVAADFIRFHSRMRIIEKAKNNGEKPFGYIIDYLKNYGLCKTESWETAEAICRYYNIAY